jgi:hypothetical protein
MNLTVDQALTLATSCSRVCPVPSRWNSLYLVLQRITHSKPPVPLILNGWVYSSDQQKASRLREQIEWAHSHSVLDRAYRFLIELPEDDWHHW